MPKARAPQVEVADGRVRCDGCHVELAAKVATYPGGQGIVLPRPHGCGAHFTVV